MMIKSVVRKLRCIVGAHRWKTVKDRRFCKGCPVVEHRENGKWRRSA